MVPGSEVITGALIRPASTTTEESNWSWVQAGGNPVAEVARPKLAQARVTGHGHHGRPGRVGHQAR